MKTRSTFILIVVLMLGAVILSACGGGTIEISDIPAYPNAVALEPGDDPIADTLANNAEQDQALRGDLGIGGSVVQKAFRLPEGTTWEQVKAHFDKEMDGIGWESGLGGIAGGFAGDVLESANAGNDLFQTTIYSKDKQNLTIFRMADATNPDQPYLILSLASN